MLLHDKEMNRTFKIKSIRMTSLTFNQFSGVLVRYRRRPKICRQARRRSLGSSKSYFSPLLSKRYWVSSSLSWVIPWIYSSGTIAADIWTVVQWQQMRKAYHNQQLRTQQMYLISRTWQRFLRDEILRCQSNQLSCLLCENRIFRFQMPFPFELYYQQAKLSTLPQESRAAKQPAYAVQTSCASKHESTHHFLHWIDDQPLPQDIERSWR